jgi:hypothetical protein
MTAHLIQQGNLESRGDVIPYQRELWSFNSAGEEAAVVVAHRLASLTVSSKLGTINLPFALAIPPPAPPMK